MSPFACSDGNGSGLMNDCCTASFGRPADFLIDGVDSACRIIGGRMAGGRRKRVTSGMLLIISSERERSRGNWNMRRYLMEDFFRIVSQVAGRVSVTLSCLFNLNRSMKLEQSISTRMNLPDREHRDDLGRGQRFYSNVGEGFEEWIPRQSSLSSIALLRSSRRRGVHAENEYFTLDKDPWVSYRWTSVWSLSLSLSYSVLIRSASDVPQSSHVRCMGEDEAIVKNFGVFNGVIEDIRTDRDDIHEQPSNQFMIAFRR